MPQVIEWKNPGKDDIVWRYPDERIEWGAQLIVREYEVAVFFRDGKAYDVLGPGRHMLTTLNLPLLTDYLTRLLGFTESPFKATIIFVSTKQFQGKFGGRSQTTDLAPLTFYGGYWFRVGDPKIFVNEVVGGKDKYTTSEVNEFIRGFINERLIDFLAKYDLLTVFTKIDDVSFKAKATVQDEFKRIGLELVDLKFEGIDTTPEYRERLFWIKQSGQAAYVLQMETAKTMAKELGKSPGAGFGAGMVMIPPVFTPPPPQPATVQPAVTAPAQTKKCPNCKRDVPLDAKFCPYCGFDFSKASSSYCPNCGAPLPPGAKFCPKCGKKIAE